MRVQVYNRMKMRTIERESEQMEARKAHRADKVARHGKANTEEQAHTFYPLKHPLDRARAPATAHGDIEMVVVGGLCGRHYWLSCLV